MREKAGPYRVTGFALPVPPRAGPIDFSFYVEEAATGRAVLDAGVQVAFHLAPGHEMAEGRRWLPPCCLMDGGESIGVPQSAYRERGGNRLLYEVIALIPEPGLWRLEGTVTRHGEQHAFQAMVEVQPAGAPLLAYWPLLLFPFAAITLFGLAQGLKFRKPQAAHYPS